MHTWCQTRDWWSCAQHENITCARATVSPSNQSLKTPLFSITRYLLYPQLHGTEEVGGSTSPEALHYWIRFIPLCTLTCTVHRLVLTHYMRFLPDLFCREQIAVTVHVLVAAAVSWWRLTGSVATVGGKLQYTHTHTHTWLSEICVAQQGGCRGSWCVLHCLQKCQRVKAEQLWDPACGLWGNVRLVAGLKTNTGCSSTLDHTGLFKTIQPNENFDRGLS